MTDSPPPAPVLSGVTPDPLVADQPVTLSGTGLAAVDVVNFVVNGQTYPVAPPYSSQSDTEIALTLGYAPDGSEVDITVEITAASGDVTSNTLASTISVPPADSPPADQPPSGPVDWQAEAEKVAPQLTADFVTKYGLDDDYLQQVATGGIPGPPYTGEDTAATDLHFDGGAWQVTPAGVAPGDTEKEQVGRT
jgi:hypothetical protein